MNLHEELEKYIKSRCDFYNKPSKYPRHKVSFTEACGLLGELLLPSASANNVWRWCRKGRVPNKRYHASILERTGIDFSKAGNTERHRKLKTEGVKNVRCVLPVDFQDLQWAYAETPCVGCFIDGGSDECENAVLAITGLKCKSRNFVLKRKPTWEVCTKQNTKVGDIVRRRGVGSEWEVKYILVNDIPEMMVVNFSGLEDCEPMSLFEVEI